MTTVAAEDTSSASGEEISSFLLQGVSNGDMQVVDKALADGENVDTVNGKKMNVFNFPSKSLNFDHFG